jgi:inhibitor of KinA sporulation pathway (predicted exonuclease)
MNLIVFDLEWNQCPSGKDHEIKKLPFEIIEIGAVKLNEKKEVLDTFHALIRPAVYQRLHKKTSEVISLTMDQLKDQGIPFPKAVKAFLDWCGTDVRFCTWGTLDLTELQRNLIWYGMGALLPGPVIYEDVQKLFALTYENRKVRRALNWAVAFLQLPEDREYHDAIDDAVYTARILQLIPDGIICGNYSIDCYQNPKSRAEEIRIRYGTYEKFISREFDTREEAMADGNVSAVRCFSCHKNVRRVVRWFVTGSHNYVAVGKCEAHGFVKSKVRLRKTEDGKVYAIKTTKMISSGDMEKIRGKQSKLRLKRYLKRKK